MNKIYIKNAGFGTYSTTTTTATHSNPLTIASNKSTIASIGFKYNKKISCWELELKTTIRLASMDITMREAMEDNVNPVIIEELKEAKRILIEKLTAKIILAELIKPKEIKETL